MLLYDAKSPAPRCLRMFLLEKQLRLPALTVDVFAGENRQLTFLAINPAGQTPALRCDDGSTLGEAVAIAEYLEELHPSPALIREHAGAAGADPAVVAAGGTQCHQDALSVGNGDPEPSSAAFSKGEVSEPFDADADSTRWATMAR